MDRTICGASGVSSWNSGDRRSENGAVFKVNGQRLKPFLVFPTNSPKSC